jgi:hypothetical protein
LKKHKGVEIKNVFLKSRAYGVLLRGDRTQGRGSLVRWIARLCYVVVFYLEGNGSLFCTREKGQDLASGRPAEGIVRGVLVGTLGKGRSTKGQLFCSLGEGK